MSTATITPFKVTNPKGKDLFLNKRIQKSGDKETTHYYFSGEIKDPVAELPPGKVVGWNGSLAFLKKEPQA